MSEQKRLKYQKCPSIQMSKSLLGISGRLQKLQ